MPFEKKPETARVRSVRVLPSVEERIKTHYKTLANGLRVLAEQLTQLDENLKKLGK